MIKHSQERALSVSDVSWVIYETNHGVLRIVLDLKSQAGQEGERNARLSQLAWAKYKMTDADAGSRRERSGMWHRLSSMEGVINLPLKFTLKN